MVMCSFRVEQQVQEFRFHYLPDTKFQSFGNPAIQPLLEKWGFGPDMVMCSFRVEQNVGPDSMQAMLDAFFRDREVVRILHALTGIRIHQPDKVQVGWGRMG